MYFCQWMCLLVDIELQVLIGLPAYLLVLFLSVKHWTFMNEGASSRIMKLPLLGVTKFTWILFISVTDLMYRRWRNNSIFKWHFQGRWSHQQCAHSEQPIWTLSSRLSRYTRKTIIVHFVRTVSTSATVHTMWATSLRWLCIAFSNFTF